MQGENRVTGSIIDEIASSNIQQYKMEGESGFNRSIINEIHS